METKYVWTNGSSEVFGKFYLITENYYSTIIGGESKRKGFIPYNISSNIEDVLLVYCDDIPSACSGLKRYSDSDVEIKRVWVEEEYRGRHIATEMMNLLEQKAKQNGYKRMILQTREIMEDAVGLYRKLVYHMIDSFAPYDKLDGAICLAKEI